MTLRREEYQALKLAKAYLVRELTSDRPKSAKQRRTEAYSCLRHFPFLHENGQPMWNELKEEK